MAWGSPRRSVALDVARIALKCLAGCRAKAPFVAREESELNAPPNNPFDRLGPRLHNPSNDRSSPKDKLPPAGVFHVGRAVSGALDVARSSILPYG
jgi:hypothetical protein